MLGLDVLMFLEPFGLLPIVPLPERMRQFIPAYKATRIIAEVMLESPLTYLLTYLLTHLLTYLLTYSLTRRRTCVLTYFFR